MQVPLALPAIMAGVRITTVSTIALLTVGGVIEKGGLGQLMFDAFQSSRNSMLLVSVVLIVALALIADLLLLLRAAAAHAVGTGRAMNVFDQAWHWLTTSDNWVDNDQGDGILHLAWLHIEIAAEVRHHRRPSSG